MALHVVLTVFAAASGLVVLATLVGLVAGATRRWSLARRASRLASIVAALQLGVGIVGVVAVPLLLGAFRGPSDPVVGAEVDPSRRARVLAQGISEWMNVAAFGVLFGVVAVPMWIVARRRERAAIGQGG